jgi:hypothetical protein
VCVCEREREREREMGGSQVHVGWQGGCFRWLARKKVTLKPENAKVVVI